MNYLKNSRLFGLVFFLLSSRVLCGSSIRQLSSAITVIRHAVFPKPFVFCRIHGVCSLGDGTILLPEWMRSHAGQIAECGLPNVSYSLTPFLNTPRASQVVLLDDEGQGEKPKEPSLEWRSNMQSFMELSDEFRVRDLLGGPTPSADRYHLATTLTPLIHLLDLFTRPSTYSPHVATACSHPPASSQFAKPPAYTHDCNPTDLSAADVSTLNPILMVDSRITDTKDFQWPKCILRLLRSSLSGNFNPVDHRDLYSWKIRSKGQCFRSLLTTNVDTSDIPANAMSVDNLFFSENGLTRMSASKKHQHSIANCVVKVLILNRYGKRFIEGVQSLASGITAYSSLLRNQASHINIQPEIIFFENSSFHEQVSVIQEAGVIVSTHGESNANFMFARPETKIFEILPFGYRPKDEDYQNLSQAYGARYIKVTSQPDKQVFAACIRHFNPNVEVSKKAKRYIKSEQQKLKDFELMELKVKQREIFLKNWNMFADTFINGTVEHGRNILSSYVVPDEIRRSPLDQESIIRFRYKENNRYNYRKVHDENVLVKRIRECAGYQRVSVDVRDLARVVVVAGAKQCPIHTDLSMLQT